MTTKQKIILTRIILAAIGFGALLIYPAKGIGSFILFVTAFLIISYDVVWQALRDLLCFSLFDEKLLMTIASSGAIYLGEYPEALAIMLFYQTGELFLNSAKERSKKSIAELMNITPEYATFSQGVAEIRKDPKDIRIGDIIVVRTGDRIPLDGTVMRGRAAVDTAALTGEVLPREYGINDTVMSGGLCVDGVIWIKVSSEYKNSTVSKILALVETAKDKKANVENFITRFSYIYTPVVVFMAMMLAVIPAVISGVWTVEWLNRAILFLVTACPCALVMSVPLCFFGGIGAASRMGVLVKGSCYLEQLASIDVAVFDKTGTLTYGRFEVTEICSSIDKDELLTIAATAEQGSNHPIARSICDHCNKPLQKPEKVQEIPGKGVIADRVACGNYQLMEHIGAECDAVISTGTVVYVARDCKYLGHIIISDKVKENSSILITELHRMGVYTVMLTGDNMAAARTIADAIDIDEVHAELMPHNKLAKLEEIKTNSQGRATVCYVGDGINDAPVLMAADVGISMGAMGSDAAIEAADIVLMDDDPIGATDAVYIARHTLAIVMQNIVFALSVKALVLILGALGITGIWTAVFADVGVSILTALNAMRCMKTL